MMQISILETEPHVNIGTISGNLYITVNPPWKRAIHLDEIFILLESILAPAVIEYSGIICYRNYFLL